MFKWKLVKYLHKMVCGLHNFHQNRHKLSCRLQLNKLACKISNFHQNRKTDINWHADCNCIKWHAGGITSIKTEKNRETICHIMKSVFLLRSSPSAAHAKRFSRGTFFFGPLRRMCSSDEQLLYYGKKWIQCYST